MPQCSRLENISTAEVLVIIKWQLLHPEEETSTVVHWISSTYTDDFCHFLSPKLEELFDVLFTYPSES